MNSVSRPSVLMVAAENGHLPHGKVGGIGDVIKDVPGHLIEEGCQVQVISPGYGILSKSPGMCHVQEIVTSFNESELTAQLYCQIDQKSGLSNWVVEHPWITHKHPGQIYYNDPDKNPYATDATRFALFCKLVASLLQQDIFGDLDVVHLHDWHAATLLLLKNFSSDPLPDHRYVYTIHNLALQGIRPLRGNHSSLFNWFPDLLIDKRVIDPRWPECINLMRTGIRLADQVHVVSPSYAGEILRPDDPVHGIHGGEGLENDLMEARSEKRLTGILNGCEYPAVIPGQKLTLRNLIDLCRQQLVQWMSEDAHVSSAHFVSMTQLESLRKRTGQTLVTSIGRLTDQKVGLLRLALTDGTPVLHQLLKNIGEDGCLFLLGSGDESLEQFMVETSARFENFIFLKGYSDILPEALYRSGKLFLMPSLFEPCGISQMLAMRAGQPCVVNLVGGLKDTIQDSVNGYGFSSDNLADLATQLVQVFGTAFDEASRKSTSYQRISQAATTSRFQWQQAAQRYINELYTTH